ncbi:hypothetical protein A0H81_12851 [Grifola frondosa]|uniref:Uncharacterized protein n=1 Tax=Grifola frondosa TaxID=5627 RepID=A0A1C7LRE0_GRIFR|nr:hypothetical protein A0H81_12851 [Grifola frondosa]
MYLKNGYTDIVFDVSDVLLSWPSDLSFPSSLVKSYEDASLPKRDGGLIETAWCEVRDHLRPCVELVALIRELKTSNTKIRVFGTLNVSAPDYDFFTKAIWIAPFLMAYSPPTNCTLVCRIPRSSDMSSRTPRATSFGMHGIILTDLPKVCRELRNLVGDPVKRGWDYLRQNAGHHLSEIDNGMKLMENFGQLMLLEMTGDRKGVLTQNDYLPNDLDTTCLGLFVTKPPKEHVYSLMEEILSNLNDDGLPWTYFDPNLPRLCPVVCTNVLHLFYTHGRGTELPGALAWVHEVLLNRAYLDEGTRYYFAGSFLYFVGRLLRTSDDAHLHGLLEDLLRERVLELVGSAADPLGLAMRILTCASVGIRDEQDMRMLLPLQCDDGGWEIGWITKYGISGMKVGNRGYTTAMAIRAIEALDELRAQDSTGAKGQ